MPEKSPRLALTLSFCFQALFYTFPSIKGHSCNGACRQDIADQYVYDAPTARAVSIYTFVNKFYHRRYTYVQGVLLVSAHHNVLLQVHGFSSLAFVSSYRPLFLSKE